MQVPSLCTVKSPPVNVLLNNQTISIDGQEIDMSRSERSTLEEKIMKSSYAEYKNINQIGLSYVQESFRLGGD